jgi:hypothetical protein
MPGESKATAGVPGRIDPFASPLLNDRNLREAAIHYALGDRNPRTAPRATQTLTLSVALDRRRNLAQVRVEHADGDGARFPIRVKELGELAAVRTRVTQITARWPANL